MKLEQARIDFAQLQKKICAFNHATALIYFDGETTAPPDTADNRAQSLQILHEEVFRLKTGPETVELLEYLDENRNLLSLRESRSVDFMMRELKKKKNIPSDEYVKYETSVTKAQDAWHRAREEEDFNILAPYLDEIFQSQKRFAEYCFPGNNPYDYCLDNYEEGLTEETCDELFDAIKENVVDLLRDIADKPQVDDSCLIGDFSTESQEELSLYIMSLIGLNMNRVGFATSEHPFTTFLGSHFDERIATRFSRKNFAHSLYTVLYEGGHVLYDTGQADNLAYTVLDGGLSMGMLESQGRFYEHFVGRNRTFLNYIFPELQELFPENLGDKTSEDLYKAVNKVEPSLIRIDADELTFSLHVLVRYELEKAMMKGDITAKDLPDAWNQKYKEYLGVDVPHISDGVLQDIHWPFGALGYFPAYVLGNAYAAQLVEKMQTEIDLEECLAEGNFDLINLWNKEHIWKHGGLYTSKELMEKFADLRFDTAPYIRYLRGKFGDIYGL